MVNLLRIRRQQGFRTQPFPGSSAKLPERFRGCPDLKPGRCLAACDGRCAAVCPTGALTAGPLRLDLGACVFCNACAEACPAGAIHFTPEYRMATSRREDLVLDGTTPRRLAQALDARMRRLFGRSLRLRQVSAGGCNGCESELVALGNVVFDLSRFGIQFVASPRHADGVVVTGPVTAAMASALRATYEAVPEPRLVIAVGACAIQGGPFRGSPAVSDGVPADLPVDLYVPGCPPHPFTIADGLLRLLGRLEEATREEDEGGGERGARPTPGGVASPARPAAGDLELRPENLPKG